MLGRPSKKLVSGRVVIYILMILLVLFLGSMIIVFTKENPEAVYKKNNSIRTEVLNGCGVNRLAIKVANLLRNKGFNVVRIGDASQAGLDETVVLERNNENMENAEYFAKRIGCKNVGKDVDNALFLDVTIIIGHDYKKIFPDVEKEF